MIDQRTLYVREVSSFGEIRIRDGAEAEEHLLRDEYLIGRATEVRRQGLFADQRTAAHVSKRAIARNEFSTR